MPDDDRRLYVPRPEGWQAKLKQGWEKEYCFGQNPDEEHYHLLVSGEVYVEHGDEKYCLNCALRLGHLTTDRLYWQRRGGASEGQSQQDPSTS